METATATVPNPEVAQTFADLDTARTALRDADNDCRAERRSLRRFARAHKFGLREARRFLFAHDYAAFTALGRAEHRYTTALAEFRRVALIAALTRIVDNDRQRRAA